MEESNTMIEVSGDLVTDMKNDCSGSSNCGCAKENSFASMPICFLVKEHAKSVVAIKELQKRMEHVETIQNDVLDAVIDISNYLKGSQKSPSSFNSTAPAQVSESSFSALTKANSLKLRRCSYSLSPLKETQVMYCGMLKRRAASLRDLTRDLKREVPSDINEQDDAQKLLDIAKTKELALESDKQDSGLDSDCRDHVSLNKASSNWPQQESKDELMHLLDEIGHKSETLQRQLLNVEQNGEVRNEMSHLQSHTQGLQNYLCDVEGQRDLLKSKLDLLETSSRELTYEKQELQQKLLSTLAESQKSVYVAENSMANVFPKHNFNVCSAGIENKQIFQNSSKMRKSATKKIDSVVVASVLKENNVVELQRQILLYLVENAVLHSKLSEVEQLLLRKTHSENSESGPSHETRALMEENKELQMENRELLLENRELRISSTEHKVESNELKSKMATMERVLHSMTVENRELNWQLEESLGQADVTKREKPDFAASFTFGSPAVKNAKGRRISLPPRLGSSQSTNVTCSKTKLLSNSSSFLDVTIEEQDERLPAKPVGANGFNHAVPLGTSTPAAFPLQKQKELRFSTIVNASPVLPNPSGGNSIVSHYHTIRKRLKSGDKASKKELCIPENDPRCNTSPGSSFNGLRLSERKLPLESTNPFPFNTILEKLKANSEYRMSRSFAPEDRSEVDESGQRGLTNCGRTKVCESGKTSQEGSSHSRKSSGSSRNLHQRIQDILDHITAQSEETVT